MTVELSGSKIMKIPINKDLSSALGLDTEDEDKC